MKKILLYLSIIPTIISTAASDFDLKFATNFGVGLEGGTYYNLYGSKGYSKEKDKSQQAIFKNKVAYTGSFEAKILKNFNINKDLKVKVGSGASIDITKLPILNEFVKVIKLGQNAVGEEGNAIDLPHNGGWGVGLRTPFQNIKRFNGNWGLDGGVKNDIRDQMPKLIALSEKTFYISLTAFGTIEIEKILKNFSVYFGVDAGLDIVLEKIEETATYESKDGRQNFKYTLERRKSSIRPKVKGYTGINYKGFETEIGLGYPQFITIGLGYRFNL